MPRRESKPRWWRFLAAAAPLLVAACAPYPPASPAAPRPSAAQSVAPSGWQEIVVRNVDPACARRGYRESFEINGYDIVLDTPQEMIGIQRTRHPVALQYTGGAPAHIRTIVRFIREPARVLRIRATVQLVTNLGTRREVVHGSGPRFFDREKLEQAKDKILRRCRR